MKEVLPLLTMKGATDMLKEYKDMFPCWGVLQNIFSKTANHKQVCRILYCTIGLLTLQEIAELLQIAKDSSGPNIRTSGVHPEAAAI